MQLNAPLNVLIVEDSEDDTLLIIDEFRAAGYSPYFERVETAEDMEAKLRDCIWDVVIADHSLPHFSASAALDILLDSCLDIPFILVSGTVSTQTAVDMMRRGAKDFILKEDLSRLAPAVTRELKEADIRRLQRKAEEDLRHSEARLAEAQKLAHLGSYEFELPDGRAIWSEETYRIFGMDPLRPAPTVSEYMLMVYPDDRQSLFDMLDRAIHEGTELDLEYRVLSRDGALKWVHSLGRPAVTQAGAITRFIGIIIDITERRTAEAQRIEMERRQTDFYRRTIMAATEGKLIVSEPGDIDEIEKFPMAEWNIESARSVGEIRGHISRIAEDRGMARSVIEDFTHCSGEAITNAVKHASRGRAALYETDESLLLIVSDHGPGIEALALPELALKRGYTTGVSLGMGYKIMISLADIVYLSTGPKGTTVALKKRKQPAHEFAKIEALPETWTV